MARAALLFYVILLPLDFNVRAGSSACTVSVSPATDVIAGIEELDFTWSVDFGPPPAGVSPTTLPRGDLNGDHNVDGIDQGLLVPLILDKTVVDQSGERADLNDDDFLNVLDGVLFSNVLAQGAVISPNVGVVAGGTFLADSSPFANPIIFTLTSLEGGNGIAQCTTAQVTFLVPPVIEDQTFSVDENVLPGTTIGAVLATDPDSSSGLAFVILSGDPQNDLALDAMTGVLTTQGQIDFEEISEYLIEVEVMDSDLLTSTAQVTVTVEDLSETPLTAIRSSPANGASDVAVTRETILYFSNPLADHVVIDESILFAEFGGRRLEAMIHMSPARDRATLFYSENLPASARVRVTLLADSLVDTNGQVVDADNDGEPGGTTFIDFDTLSLTSIANTKLCGQVFASEQDNGNNVPLIGVTIRADGMEDTLSAVTDTQGQFCLEPAPAGRFFVHIDGSTATNSVPSGAYYPNVGKAWESIVGQQTDVGHIYLPLIIDGTLQPVSMTTETEIQFPPDVLSNHPNFAGTMLMVPPDSLFANNGARGGQVGIAPVEPDRLPGALPQGVNFPLVITVQTNGPANFDIPAPVCFPNLPDPETGETLAAGETSALWSFNHDTGEFEVVGPMTVSSDGLLVCTDEGVGVLAPGWHGAQPGTTGEGSAGRPKNPDPQCRPGCKPIKPFDAFLKSTACQIAIGQIPFIGNWFANEVISSVASAAVCPDFKDALDDYDQCLEFRAQHLQLPICSDNQNRFLISPVEHALSDFGVELMSLQDQFNQELPLLEEAKSFALIAQPLMEQADFDMPSPFGLTSDELQIMTDALDQMQDRIILVEQSLSGSDMREVKERLINGWNDAVNIYNSEFQAQVKSPLHVYFETLEGPHNIQRFQTSTSGNYEVNLRPDTFYKVIMLDPQNLSVGLLGAQSGSNASQVTFTSIDLLDDFGTDSDGDGLIEEAEIALGTDLDNPDTDDDGINDAAEIQQGLDPLVFNPISANIIASADTPGTAADICALDDLAIIADAERGISVFGVNHGQKPIIIAQVDTPGNAQAVSCAEDIVAVADGFAGVALIDISDPPAARIRNQVRLTGSAQAVQASGNLAYVGAASGQIALVELNTGSIVDALFVNGSIQDLAIGKEVLYALSERTIHIIPLLQRDLQVASTVSSPGSVGARRLRLFSGNQVLYATHAMGYNTFDLADPLNPTLIANGDTAQSGWKHIVANGSGLGVAATNSSGSDSHHISLYDVSDPSQTNRFIAEFETPGIAAAVSIYNGLAYIADGNAGLQVINYLAFDSLGVPPTISLSTNFSGHLAEEGKLMRLTANVNDDVQVRNVEFFVDGESRIKDGNFPFEYRFITPLLNQQSTFTIKARATDTGGNFTETNEITITLVSDATPPQLEAQFPQPGATVGEVGALMASFNEPLDTSTVTANAFYLEEAGIDGVIGTGDDIRVDEESVAFSADALSAFVTFDAPLQPGLYRATLDATVTDIPGNALTQDQVWTFSVTDYTTIVGMVQLDDGTIPEGLEITVLREDNSLIGSGTVQNDGTLSMPDILFPQNMPPALRIQSAGFRGGVSNIVPVPGGLTDIGALILTSMGSKVTAGDAATGDSFGWSVSISEDTAIIGAIGDDDSTGSAYIFKKKGSNWLQQGKLVPNDGAPNENFGVSVSVDGGTAIVGSWLNNNGFNTGSAYIYKEEGPNWVQQAKLIASDVGVVEFGWSVSISGGTAIVVANPGRSSGLAYVFKQEEKTWIEQAELSTGVGGNDGFGWSASISGNTALIGAYRDDELGLESGAAYIFQREGGAWTQQAKLIPNLGVPNDWFGWSVSLDEDIAVIGTYNASQTPPAIGSAYIFSRDGKSWIEQAQLNASDAFPSDVFGSTVSVSGRDVVIGSGSEGGSAYVFQPDASAWVEKKKFIASKGGSSNAFGKSVSVDIGGNHIILGAFGDDDKARDSGAAYFFPLGSVGETTDVRGTAVFTGGSAAVGATVTLRDQDDTILATGRIQGEDGYFSFSSLPLSPGLSSLKITALLSDSGQVYSAAASGLTPIPDGLTEAGTLILIADLP